MRRRLLGAGFWQFATVLALVLRRGSALLGQAHVWERHRIVRRVTFIPQAPRSLHRLASIRTTLCPQVAPFLDGVLELALESAQTHKDDKYRHEDGRTNQDEKEQQELLKRVERRKIDLSA